MVFASQPGLKLAVRGAILYRSTFVSGACAMSPFCFYAFPEPFLKAKAACSPLTASGPHSALILTHQKRVMDLISRKFLLSNLIKMAQIQKMPIVRK